MGDEKVINEEAATPDSEQLQAQVTELQNLMAKKDEELAQANARLAEIKEAVANTDRMLAQAVTSYKAMVVKANPGIPEELVTGNTVDEVNTAVTQATTLVNKVKQGLAAEMAATRVPAGAPERTSVNLEALTPREKIQYALGGKK